jgi:hypothetical protein
MLNIKAQFVLCELPFIKVSSQVRTSGIIFLTVFSEFLPQNN